MCVCCMHELIFIHSCEAVRECIRSVRECPSAKRRNKVQGSSDPTLNDNFTSSLEMFEGVEIDGALINW
jgi:hypothetical protein